MTVRAKHVALRQFPPDRADRPRICRRDSEVLLPRVTVVQVEGGADTVTAPYADQPPARYLSRDRPPPASLVCAPCAFRRSLCIGRNVGRALTFCSPGRVRTSNLVKM